MDRWNWFLSANYSGKWIVTNGYALVEQAEKEMQALLRFSPDADPYASVVATFGDAGKIEATVKSFNSKTASYILSGFLYSEKARKEGQVTSIILTDGYTVLGLAKGSRSDEANLA